MLNSVMSLLEPYNKYNDRQKKAWGIFSGLCFLAAAVLMLWHAQYGFASSDEAFYLTVPYRLTQGAALFTDEWHVSQMSGILLYPFMKLFLLIRPDGTGMILAFRFLFAAVSACASLYIYTLCIRRFSPLPSLAAALMLMLFAPYSIAALSYNSMGLILVCLACFSSLKLGERGNVCMVFSGLCFSAAVLCCPYLLAVFVLYCLATVLTFFARKKSKVKTLLEIVPPLRLSAFIAFCLGCALMLAAFCAIVFSRTGLRELIENIPYILADEEHSSTYTFSYRLKRYLGGIYYSSRKAPIAIFFGIALLAALCIDKGRQKRCLLYWSAALIISLIFALPFYSSPNANLFMSPLTILGLFSFLLCEKKQWSLFLQVYIPGILYSVCLHLSSNQWFLAISMALAVSSIASVFFIAEFMEEIASSDEGSLSGKLRGLAAVSFVLLVSAQLATQVYFDINLFQYEPNIKYLDSRVEYGVQKGLITTESTRDKYYAVMQDTQTVREEKEGLSLYFSDDVWLLLQDKKPTAAYSGWLGFENPDISAERLLSFWELHPEKLPDNIYVKNEFYYGYKESFFGEEIVNMLVPLGYSVETCDTGFILAKMA